MLHAGAFNWTFTLGTGLTDPWANGATAIIYTGEKDPAMWPRMMAETGATLFAGVPGVYRQMLKYAKPAPTDFGVLRHGLMAGESPPPGLFEDWEARTGRPLYEALGMSEISTYVSSGPGVPRKPGAVGKAQAGRRLAVLPLDGGSGPLPAGEEGLLAVHRSDPGLMLGYWRRPQEERDVYRGEWFVGGDIAVIDADGYVFHRGRANDLMKALGYRVSPLEVEAVLAEHPVNRRSGLRRGQGARRRQRHRRLHRSAAERAPRRRRHRALRRRPPCRLQTPAQHRFCRGAAAHRQRQAHAPGPPPSRWIFHRLALWHPRRGPSFSSPALHTS